MHRSLRSALVCLAGVALALPGCGSRGPRVVEYEPGRFYFDWGQASRVSTDARMQFRRTFEQRVEVLATALQEPDVTRALRVANAANRPVPLAEILERDQRWQLAQDDSAVRELTDAACNAALQRLAATFQGYAEILVTDLRGANVCVTGRTTDYYQADEDWWVGVSRADSPHNGRMEFDESAGVIGVPAYLPLFDANGNRIGFAKAIIEHDIARPDVAQ